MSTKEKTMKVDLSTCEPGDTLISSLGTILEDVAPTPWKQYMYMDHVVRYVKRPNGDDYNEDNYGTRTNDGFVFAKNRISETDHDIVKIIKK